jgi:hypothetical protein
MKTGRAYCPSGCGSQVQKEALVMAAKKQRGPEWRMRASERMKKKNPMWIPGIKEKMIVSMKGKKLVARGGNGQITKQQEILQKATGLVTEYPVTTTLVKDIYPSAPHSYKVDLADPNVKLAVEVDGKSHKLPSRKLQDSKKTEVLNSLEWTVLRFTNEEVDSNLSACVQTITSTISKLKTITTIS